MKLASHALLIDDNPDCNFIMREFILMVDDGIAVSQVESAKQAEDLLAGTGDFPEVIFVDINMPITDGFTFVQGFQERYGVPHSTKLYMLSSSVREEDMDKAASFPAVHGFISKSDIDANLKSALMVSHLERA
ncbi:MAG: response regulator [Flavobacteriales bacterium]